MYPERESRHFQDRRRFERGYGRDDREDFDHEDRGFIDRAAEKVRSWFDDEEDRRDYDRDRGFGGSRRYGRDNDRDFERYDRGYDRTGSYGRSFGSGYSDQRRGYGSGYDRDRSFGGSRRYGRDNDRDFERYDRGYDRTGSYGRSFGSGYSDRERSLERDSGHSRGRGFSSFDDRDYDQNAGFGGREEREDTWSRHNRLYGQSAQEGGPGDNTGRSSFTYAEYWIIPGPYAGIGPQGYESTSTDQIKEQVCRRLSQHGAIDASNIQVTVDNGEVTLQGQVSDRRTKRMAEDVAESVSGVRDVHNRIRVQRESQSKTSGSNGSGMSKAQSGSTSRIETEAAGSSRKSNSASGSSPDSSTSRES